MEWVTVEAIFSPGRFIAHIDDLYHMITFPEG
jgi:hypothetical protein